jgi:hypothetical protein
MTRRHRDYVSLQRQTRQTRPSGDSDVPAIAAAAPVALAGLAGDRSSAATARRRGRPCPPGLVFAFTCYCLAVIFCLVTGIEAVAHERLSSPAFDPLSGFETQRLRINQRYLQNTLEQIVFFGAALFGLAVYASDGAAMRAVLVLSSGC